MRVNILRLDKVEVTALAMLAHALIEGDKLPPDDHLRMISIATKLDIWLANEALGCCFPRHPLKRERDSLRFTLGSEE